MGLSITGTMIFLLQVFAHQSSVFIDELLHSILLNLYPILILTKIKLKDIDWKKRGLIISRGPEYCA